MTNIISLGPDCKNKFHIDNYFNLKVETHFFDTLLTNFSSIIYILENINNRALFLKEEFFEKVHNIYPGRYYEIPISNTKIRMVSLHDVKGDEDYSLSLNKFIEKYDRRLTRLENLIKNNKYINFIHSVNKTDDLIYIPDLSEIVKFFSVINKINNTIICNLYIILIPEYHYLFDIFNEKLDNLYIFKIENKFNIIPEWQMFNLDWKLVFDNINNVIEKQI